jgi:DUF1365 family protein
VTVEAASALYFGRVTHTRLFPRRHRLSYGLWYLLADLDELPELDRTLPGFTFDRAGPVSFHTRDHGPRDGSPLRPWVESSLERAGIDLEGGAIRILCFPRVLGYVFNPLSVWFCHHRDGSLRALLYEVSNTFGERHSYLVPVDRPAAPGEVVRREFDKELFVSPFIDMQARYDFATRVPDDRLSVVVRESVVDGRVLVAALTARRAPLTRSTLARAFFGYPLVTLKVIAGIHLEALKLWIKGAPYRRRGEPPAEPVTVLARTDVLEEVA